MTNMTLEQIKQQDLCRVLRECYGMQFVRRNGAWEALSPFQQEQRPSFFVKQAADGHWLFKDFSVNLGGSLIDFVLHYEKLADFPSAFRRARELVGHGLRTDGSVPPAPAAAHRRPHHLDELHRRFRQRDAAACGQYLRKRGIDDELVDRLLADGTVVQNRYGGALWCCVALRDATGKLQGLFNRCLSGDEKFLLGRRAPFCLDWERLQQAETVYLCEGIIDALSLKSLLGVETVVVGIGGNQLCAEAISVLSKTRRIVAAFDADEGGKQAWTQLGRHFEADRIERFDLCGHNDPNALLQARLAQDTKRCRSRLSPDEKADVAFAPHSSREVAAKHGLHHSRVCELRQEARSAACEHWQDRRPGPKAESLDWQARNAALEAELAEVSRERDLLCMRRDWLELQLSWEREQEQAAAERASRTKKNARKRQRKSKRSSH
ncbi:toprim domain-containing protein [PVC group bacterium]|nr:toprim domain-containing protein [PVC group bacterium]